MGVMLLVAHRTPSGFLQSLGLCPPGPSRPPSLVSFSSFRRLLDTRRVAGGTSLTDSWPAQKVMGAWGFAVSVPRATARRFCVSH